MEEIEWIQINATNDFLQSSQWVRQQTVLFFGFTDYSLIKKRVIFSSLHKKKLYNDYLKRKEYIIIELRNIIVKLKKHFNELCLCLSCFLLSPFILVNLSPFLHRNNPDCKLLLFFCGSFYVQTSQIKLHEQVLSFSVSQTTNCISGSGKWQKVSV